MFHSNMHLKVCRPNSNVAEIDCPPEDLRPVFEAIRQEDGSFFILSQSDHQFLQGYWIEGEGFHLEFFEPDTEGYHRTPQPISSELATKVAELYGQQNPNWRPFCEWQYELEREFAEPERDGRLGHFDGVGLRRVLEELERHHVPCRLEQDGMGFIVFVPPEEDEKARALVADLFPQ